MNWGVIWFELILGMDLIICHFLGLNPLLADGVSCVKELEALTTQEAMRVRAGGDRGPKRRKAEGGSRHERPLADLALSCLIFFLGAGKARFYRGGHTPWRWGHAA